MRRKVLMAGMGVLLLAGFLTAGCEHESESQSEPPSQAEQILKGEHRLRRMTERVDFHSKISGNFFLFAGGLNGTANTAVVVKFAWEMNDGVYSISSLPLEKFRVKLDENAVTPTIKFRWRRYRGRGTPQVQGLMDNYVLYALITAKESDWPIRVRLPLNSQ